MLKRLRKALGTVIRFVLRPFHFSIPWRFGSARLRIPLAGGTGLGNLRGREANVATVIAGLARESAGTFVDVGANIGQTLIALASANSRMTYLGFEPNAQCAGYVAKLIEQNEMRGCSILPIALSNATGVVPLSTTGGTSDVASIAKGTRPASFYAATVPVFAARGEEVLAALRIDDVALLKIDVEGGELEVLEGLRTTLQAQRPYVVCEVLPVYTAETAEGALRLTRQTALERLLAEERYVIHRIGPLGELERTQTFGIHSDLAMSNYLFSPAERDAAPG